MRWDIMLVLALLVLVVGYRLWRRRGVNQVSVHEVKARLVARDRILLIDVREPKQFQAGHIRGAINIPLSRLEQEAQRLDSKVEMIVLCQTGHRSMTAYHKLKAMGFEDVRHLEGGMMRWSWETVK